jgi:hypothetical protein
MGKTIQKHRAIGDITQVACHLASRQDIRAVHIVSSQRLTDNELLRLQACAHERGVEFTNGASGHSFHRAPDLIETGDDGPPMLLWLRAQSKAWRAALGTLSAGAHLTRS